MIDSLQAAYHYSHGFLGILDLFHQYRPIDDDVGQCIAASIPKLYPAFDMFDLNKGLFFSSFITLLSQTDYNLENINLKSIKHGPHSDLQTSFESTALFTRFSWSSYMIEKNASCLRLKSIKTKWYILCLSDFQFWQFLVCLTYYVIASEKHPTINVSPYSEYESILTGDSNTQPDHNLDTVQSASIIFSLLRILPCIVLYQRVFEQFDSYKMILKCIHNSHRWELLVEKTIDMHYN